MRASIVILVAVALGACTFPDVDYADGDAGATGGSGSTGSGDGGATTCAAPPMCADQAMSCTDTPDKKHGMCTQKCKPNESACVAACDATLASALGACRASCESCAAAMCGTKSTNCGALVGL